MKYDDPIEEAIHILACCCSGDFMDQLKAALKAKDDRIAELEQQLAKREGADAVR